MLRDVTLRVPDGTVVALLGPNGSGKTTLLRVAAGLLDPSGGRVVLDGDDVTTLAPHQRRARGVCLVPEGRGVFPALTVRENLRVFSRGAGIDRAVEAFPVLGQRLDQVAGTLSGGEQQMLALSRAYAEDARLVMLDEVSMGLAPKVVDEILAFLARLVAQGTSLLLVEQYVAKALELADYVCVLDRGRLAFAGEGDELSVDDILASYLGGGVGATR
ncbi:MAG: ABC transporter ATP-binding protein [Actinobacteria bacterium]|nr:ABC transporter ATP-binding protein [Actinomycetota bacterium]